MIETKLFEVRDAGMVVPVMATAMMALLPCTPDLQQSDEVEREAETALLKRCGYLQPDGQLAPAYVLLSKLRSPEVRGYTQLDPNLWDDQRVMGEAHRYIGKNWITLRSGDVIDCEFIRGETSAPKQSERMAVAGQ